MKKYIYALLLAMALFGCIRTNAQSNPTCSGRFDERLQKCVEYSDSVFSSESLYEGKYVCFWGTLASQSLLAMPSTTGSRVQIHPSWGSNSPPAIGSCTRALANVCGTFSSTGGIYQLLDAQSIGIDTGDCSQEAAKPATPTQAPAQQPTSPQPAPTAPSNSTESPPAPPTGNAGNQPTSGSTAQADMPPPPPSDSSDMPPLPPA